MMKNDKLPRIAEGKTKIVYENPADENTVYLFFKDDITAGDGLKHDVILGKAVLDWQVNRDCFEYLNRVGVQTHYISSPEERVVLIKKLDRKIDLEVVSRRVATGSILQWRGDEEGTRFDPVITQFHYKDDPLHDPMLDDQYVDYMIRAKGSQEYALMRQMNDEIFVHLERAFAHFKVQLVDMKLEYGIINGQVHLIDEISGGSFRLWPYRRDNPDLTKPNVIGELDPGGRLDKDIYRMGGDLDEVLVKFASIAKITEGFKTL
jgi:phosphoribosylaminoimidazole-succinocarboxamide synthase